MRTGIRALVLTVALVISPCAAVFTAQAQPQAASQQSPAKGAPERANPAPSDNVHVDNVRVWVNTASGIYHCPGAHWYGKTKSGQYLTQKEALQKVYRAAYHRPCK